LDEALILTNGAEDTLLAAEIWLLQARLGRFSSTPAMAHSAFERARGLFRDVGAWRQVTHVDQALAELRT
jgi:hypothetical protein